MCIQPLSRNNLLSSRRGVGKGLSGQTVRAAYPYWPLWLAYFALSLNAWAASVVFHSRDVRRTEVCDLASWSSGTCSTSPETPAVTDCNLPRTPRRAPLAV
jgi:hypothetical protein